MGNVSRESVVFRTGRCSFSRALSPDWILERYCPTELRPFPSFVLRYQFGMSHARTFFSSKLQVLLIPIYCRTFEGYNFFLMLYRPTFRYFSWHTALLGLMGTLVMMFVINAVYASVSLLLCLVLIICLHFFSPARTANWGSISQAIIFHQVWCDWIIIIYSF